MSCVSTSLSSPPSSIPPLCPFRVRVQPANGISLQLLLVHIRAPKWWGLGGREGGRGASPTWPRRKRWEGAGGWRKAGEGGGGDGAGDAPSLVFFFFPTSQLRRRGVLSVSPACGETQQQAAGSRVSTLAAGGVVCVCVCTQTHTQTRAHIFGKIMFGYSHNFICIAEFPANSTGSCAASSASVLKSSATSCFPSASSCSAPAALFRLSSHVSCRCVARPVNVVYWNVISLACLNRD